MVLTAVLTFVVLWAVGEIKDFRRGTELTGSERSADLTRLNGASSQSSDQGEQSNTQNFAMAYSVQEAKIDYEVFLNPDCSPRTNFYLSLREKPMHGTARIDLDRNYTGYDRDGQRYKCNLLPTQSPSIFYRRNVGFTGQDHFTVEVFEPDGAVRSTRYVIDAR